MRVAVRVVFPDGDPKIADLQMLVPFVRSLGGWVGILKEGDQHWADFVAVLPTIDPEAVSIGLTSTEAEVKRASWCSWRSTGTTGYPEPEGEYLDLTYDRSNGCTQCNADKTQVAPFRMRGEPQLGRREVMQLGWVYDEWFATPGIYETVFKPFGIPQRPVLTKAGRVLTSVVQLVIDEVVPVDEYRQVGEICSLCRRAKLHAGPWNVAPAPSVEPASPIARSSQWLGSGGSAFRETLVRSELVSAIRDAKVRGMKFAPCATAVERAALEARSGVPPIKGGSMKIEYPWRFPTQTPFEFPEPAEQFGSEADRAAARRSRRLLEQSNGLASVDALLIMSDDFRRTGEMDAVKVLLTMATAQDSDEARRQLDGLESTQ